MLTCECWSYPDDQEELGILYRMPAATRTP
jgi:hypothetical protein